jgi:hypothetical protein
MVRNFILKNKLTPCIPRILAGFILLLALTSFSSPVHALDGNKGLFASNMAATNPSQETELDLKPVKNGGVSANESTINSVKNIVFGLAGSLALLFVVIGGFRYILSRGDPNATAQAKNTIIYALVGLIVTVLAYAIVGFAIGNL